MPVTFFPLLTGKAKWGEIEGTISNQSDLQDVLEDKAPVSHCTDSNNPHSVTKEQVGLGNVTNDAALKRSGGDINSFTLKDTPANSDVLLIEDSADSFAKKKITVESLAGEGTSDNKVKISSDDSVADYLNNKVTVSEGLKKQTVGESGSKTLDLSLDIHNTTQKSHPSGNDEIILYDAEAGTNKRASINDLFARLWVNCNGSYANSTSFTFSGDSALRKSIEGSLFTCTNSAGTVRKVGYIKSTSGDSGTITCTIVSPSVLESGDKDFKIAFSRKYWDYVHKINIPGELVADTDTPQGAWLLDVPWLVWLLAVDVKVRQAASGTSANCTVNLYRNTTSLFSDGISLFTSDVKRDSLPNTGTTLGSVDQYDNISLKVTQSAGATQKAADLQAKLYLVPQNIFEGV
ncbi:MAG: hypothetical protein WCT77_07595 [Bacteroidota bacterium]